MKNVLLDKDIAVTAHFCVLWSNCNQIFFFLNLSIDIMDLMRYNMVVIKAKEAHHMFLHILLAACCLRVCMSMCAPLCCMTFSRRIG